MTPQTPKSTTTSKSHLPLLLKILAGIVFGPAILVGFISVFRGMFQPPEFIRQTDAIHQKYCQDIKKTTGSCDPTRFGN